MFKEKAIPYTIVANWKMNGLLAPSMRYFKKLRSNILKDLISCEIVLCPPATLLRDFAEKIPGTRIKLGGQNCSAYKKGSYTGEICAEMLTDMTCEYVIIGHSERRRLFLESSETIREKALRAHEAGLKAIICVGETEEERNQGKALQIVKEQILNSIPETANYENTFIAYEPVWAIGTNTLPKVEEIEEMHMHIVNSIAQGFTCFNGKVRILYGGSVDETNAKEILTTRNVNGLLVGRASLDAESFWEIIQSVNLVYS